MEKQNEKIKLNNKTLKLFFLLFLVALLIEIFIFNIRSIDTAGYSEKKLDSSYGVTLAGGIFDDNGDIVMNGDADFVTLDISGFGYPLYNVRIDVECVDDVVSPYTEDHVCVVECSTFDDALLELIDSDGRSSMTSGTLMSTEGRVLHDVEESHYIYLEPFGNTNELRLVMYPASGVAHRLRIHDLTFNANHPLRINLIRISVVYVLLIVLCYFLSDSILWREDSVTFKRWKAVIAGGLFVGILLFTVFVMLSNKAIIMDDFSPYAELSRALCEGRLYVGEADDVVRSTEGHSVFWRADSTDVMFDYALYDGRYYVYFGLLPCLVFYLPYHILTGGAMPNVIPGIILRVLTVALTGVFIHILIRKYYRKTPFAMYLLMWMAVICGMYMPLQMTNNVQFYDIPIFSATVLTIAGASLWISMDKGSGGLNTAKAALGSVCLAAVSLCRPTMLIYGFILLGVIIRNRFSELKKAEKKGIYKYALSVVLPYAVFAVVCMAYNFLRFGSLFDFGASYNATTYPIEGASLFVPYVIFRAVYEYLLKPPFMAYGFPVASYTVWEKVRQAGNIMVVRVFDGGLLMINPFVWSLALTGFYRKRLSEKKMFGPILLMLVASLFLMVYSTVYTSSIYTRYTLEFSPVILIAGCIMLMEIFDDAAGIKDSSLFNGIRCGIALLLLVSVFWGLMQIGCSSSGDTHLSSGNTELWYRLYYACRITK